MILIGGKILNKVEAKETTLRGYLGIESDTGILTIPFSQRPYEWEKPEIERLFNDLVSIHLEEDNTHMLNFFTLSNEGDSVKIFDGQQRTITTLLIVGSFINTLKEVNEEKASAQLYSRFIRDVEYVSSTDQDVKKLIFDDKDVEEAFYSIILGNNEEYTNSEDDAIKNLAMGYQIVHDLLHKFVTSNNLDGKDLRFIIDRILNQTQLIVIKTDTDELAMAMFESLNNTGKQLENYYVLKNDMVLALGEDATRLKWQQIESNLSNFDQSDFLTSFATILYGKTTKKNSLSHIYKVVDKSDKYDMSNLLDKLAESSEKYLYVRNPLQLQSKVKTEDREDYATFRKLITNIELFINKQHYPLILALMMQEYNLSEINRVISSVLNLGIRNIYFKENRANTIENLIAELATTVYNHKIEVDQIIEQILNYSLNDSELADAIRSKKIKTAVGEKRLKFILRETYNFVDLNQELAIKDDLKKIQYEHILPKKPATNSGWLDDFNVEEELENYTFKVGNATLLIGKINNSISNKDFLVKRDQYQDSHIPENQRIANLSKWTTLEIDERTEELANKITKYLNSLI